MKILVINYEYPPVGGGGGFVTRDILEHMAAVGHDVTVITSCYQGLNRRERVNNVQIIRTPVWMRKKQEVASLPSMLSYFPSSIMAVLSGTAGGKFDILNTHFAIPSGPSGYVLSRLLKIPNVLSIHGGDIFDPSKSLSPHNTPVLWHTVRGMLKTADRVVAQSTDTKNNAVGHYIIKRPIDIIPLGIKRPFFHKTDRSHYGLSENDMVISTIGRLVKRKNLDAALKIVSNLETERPVKFLIMGDGPEKTFVEAAIKQLKIGDKVFLLGNVSDEEKFQMLDLSDIYLSTAMHEGFGLVFLEAMACGLPIVCYDRGGQVDFLKDGQTGFVVALGDTAAYGKRLIDLMGDDALRERMGRFNTELVKSYYIEACAEKYLSLFEHMISNRGLDKRVTPGGKSNTKFKSADRHDI